MGKREIQVYREIQENREIGKSKLKKSENCGKPGNRKMPAVSKKYFFTHKNDLNTRPK